MQDNKTRYVGGESRMVMTDAKTTYKELRKLLCQRFRIDRKRFHITMHMKHDGLHKDALYEIRDDMDVSCMFSLYIKASNPKPIEVFMEMTERVNIHSHAWGPGESSAAGASTQSFTNEEHGWSSWHVTPMEE